MKNTAPPQAAVQLLRNHDAAGVYHCTDMSARTLFQAAPGAGLKAWRMDLESVGDTESLHQALAKALQFPDWYGHNWDALADCLMDLSWVEADGYLLVLKHCAKLQESDPAGFDLFVETLKDSTLAWQSDEIAFWVVLVGTHPDLPTLKVSA